MLKKISGEFGLCPATHFIVWPATYSKRAQTFVKKCQKIAPGVHFLRKNVVPCWCNTKKNNTKFFYMLILTACNRVTRRNDFRPLEKSAPLLCGVCRTSKNRLFIYNSTYFFILQVLWCARSFQNCIQAHQRICKLKNWFCYIYSIDTATIFSELVIKQKFLLG